MPKLTQKGRPLRIVVGGADDDRLVAVSMTGEERVGRPFLFTVDCVSEKPTFSPKQLLGEPVALHIEATDKSKRVVTGIVRRFSRVGADEDVTRWRVEVVPKLWLLSLSSDSRVWENEALADVLGRICRDGGLQLQYKVAAPPKPRAFLVQYRETPLDFLHRMMEEFGLYYVIAGDGGAQKLIVTDAKGQSIPAGQMPRLREQPVIAGERPMLDEVTSLTSEYVVHTQDIVLEDYHLSRKGDSENATSKNAGALGKIADHIGDLGFDHWRGDARRRIEIEEAGFERVRGTSSCAALAHGTRVEIQGAGLGAKSAEYHVLAVRHRMEVGDLRAGTGLEATYDNEFEAMPALVPYRPHRTTPRPCVRGTQVAEVTGKGGIDVDAEGRVMLVFPWDTAKTPCKLRVPVASAWAGTEWGMVQHPRVGQQVLVEFLEGDPERPIVTGRVYSHTTKVPYALPGKKTQSGWKSRTLDGGADNFNEIRFDDAKGDEHVFVQAEKDLQVKVKNDETRDVLHDRITTVKHDDTRTVQEGHDTHTVKKGNQVIEVTEGDQTVTVKTGKQTVTVQADQTVNVKQGKRAVTIDTGDDLLKVKLGNLTIEVDVGNITIKAKAGKIAMEAMQGIDLKCGQSTVSMTPASIEMKSVQVKVEGQAQATVKAPMATFEGTGQATVKGAMVQVQGQGMTQVKGAITQVNGDGVLMAKGGVTMIN